jgi:hypothetical protein
MRILDRDELDEQRKKYIGFIRLLDKMAKGFEDGALRGENLRDMNSILQTRFLTFVLSELVHLSQILRVMEDQIGIDILTNAESLSDDEFDAVFETKVIEEEANKFAPISEEDRDAEEAGKLAIDTEDVLVGLTNLDDEGLDEARRLLNEIYRRSQMVEEEESD